MPVPAPLPPRPLNFRTLDLNLLRVFDAVMSERSLTRAAHQLSLTQPAVSNALRRLREALGDDLVTRHGQGMEPTARALTLWPAVREALQGLQLALAPRAFDPSHASNNFVVAMADATAGELIPALVHTLEQEAPGVSLQLAPLTTRDPRALLEDQAIDLAIGYFPAVAADLAARAQVGRTVNFAQERLYDGEYVCVMRAGHALAQEPLTLERYCEARHLLVSYSGQAYGFIDEALNALGRSRRVVFTVNQFFTAAHVAAHSDLLSVLPRHFLPLTGIAKQLAARPVPLNLPTIHVDALWHQRNDGRPEHRWLRQTVLGAARQLFGDLS